MTPEIRSYLAAKKTRAEVDRKNRGLRMTGRKYLCVPLPNLPPKPLKYVVEDAEGVCQVTEYDPEIAFEYAERNGMTVRAIPFDQPA
jgi:hypothetical protein